MMQHRGSFQFVGNDLSIDFVNTRIADRGERIDLIETPAAFAGWLAAAGLSVTGSWTRQSLAAAHQLRQAIGDALARKAAGEPPPAQAITVLNAHLAQYDERARLVYSDGTYRLNPRHDSLSPESALGLLAYRGAELLVSAGPKTLKSCANPKCVLMFKDVSRGHKRRWCSMETCGNRAKVAAHYRSSLR